MRGAFLSWHGASLLAPYAFGQVLDLAGGYESVSVWGFAFAVLSIWFLLMATVSLLRRINKSKVQGGGTQDYDS